MKQLKIDSVRKYFSSSPIILLLVLLLLSSIGALFYFFTPASRIQSNPLLKVGNETLYTEDAHYKKTKIPTLSDEKVRDMIIQESIILQSGEKRGYVVLDSSVFDHTFKDDRPACLALALGTGALGWAPYYGCGGSTK